MNSLAEFKGQNAVESPGTTVFTFPKFEKRTQPDKNVNISNHSVKQKPENFSNLYPALLTSQKRIKKKLSSPHLLTNAPEQQRFLTRSVFLSLKTHARTLPVSTNCVFCLSNWGSERSQEL